MGHFPETDTTKTEISVISSRSSADLAAVVIPYCKFLRFRHFRNPCFCSHSLVALLYYFVPFSFLKGKPMNSINFSPSLSFLAVVTKEMFIPCALGDFSTSISGNT